MTAAQANIIVAFRYLSQKSVLKHRAKSPLTPHPQCSPPSAGCAKCFVHTSKPNIATWLQNAFQVHSCLQTTPSASMRLTLGCLGVNLTHLVSGGCDHAAKKIDMFIQTMCAFCVQIFSFIIGLDVRHRHDMFRLFITQLGSSLHQVYIFGDTFERSYASEETTFSYWLLLP